MLLNSTLNALQPTAASVGRQLMSTTSNQFSPYQSAQRSPSDNTNGDSFQLVNRNTAPAPRFSGWPAENKRPVREHIQNGCQLIVRRRYEEAIDHFQNANWLRGQGISADTRYIMMKGLPETIQEAKALIRQASKINMAFNDNGSLSVKFARIVFLDPSKGGPIQPEPGTSEAEMLNFINLEQALMSAEENMHLYQDIDDGKNITYRPKPGEESLDDHEIDIATTLDKFKLPLTNDFLKRYKGRAEHVTQGYGFDLALDETGEVQWVKRPIIKATQPIAQTEPSTRPPELPPAA